MPHRATYIFGAVFALAFLAFACDRAPNQPDAAGAAGAATQPSRQLPLLVATTPMVGDVVSAVAGAHAKVVVLIGPASTPTCGRQRAPMCWKSSTPTRFF